MSISNKKVIDSKIKEIDSMCKFYIKEKLYCLSGKFENIQEDFDTKKEKRLYTRAIVD